MAFAILNFIYNVSNIHVDFLIYYSFSPCYYELNNSQSSCFFLEQSQCVRCFITIAILCGRCKDCVEKMRTKDYFETGRDSLISDQNIKLLASRDQIKKYAETEQAMNKQQQRRKMWSFGCVCRTKIQNEFAQSIYIQQVEQTVTISHYICSTGGCVQVLRCSPFDLYIAFLYCIFVGFQSQFQCVQTNHFNFNEKTVVWKVNFI